MKFLDHNACWLFMVESSSPALALKKDESAIYTQATIHLQGSYPSLNLMAKTLLGIDLDTIKR